MTEEQEKVKESRKAPRPIPHHGLEEALRVPRAVQDGNNGRPWKPLFIADYLKVSKASSAFRDLTSSAHKYGLTTGTWNAEAIGLTDLGKSLMKPTEPNQEILNRRKSVLSIDVLKRILEHYKDGKLPSGQNGYFRNTLETEFDVPKAYVDDCIRLLEDNGKFAGILFESQGSLWVTLDGKSNVTESSDGPKSELPYSSLAAGTNLAEAKSEASASVKSPSRNQIFIVHGKNQAPMKQLKSILDKFQIPYKVAVDEPHKGRPISKKVVDLMHECTSAIIVFTADEKFINAEGIEIWRPSDNAVYELGAASILYEKIVIIKEKSVTLASDFNDIGHISFEENQLEAKTMELITEFVGMGFVKITPT